MVEQAVTSSTTDTGHVSESLSTADKALAAEFTTLIHLAVPELGSAEASRSTEPSKTPSTSGPRPKRHKAEWSAALAGAGAPTTSSSEATSRSEEAEVPSASPPLRAVHLNSDSGAARSEHSHQAPGHPNLAPSMLSKTGGESFPSSLAQSVAGGAAMDKSTSAAPSAPGDFAARTAAHFGGAASLPKSADLPARGSPGPQHASQPPASSHAVPSSAPPGVMPPPSITAAPPSHLAGSAAAISSLLPLQPRADKAQPLAPASALAAITTSTATTTMASASAASFVPVSQIGLNYLSQALHTAQTQQQAAGAAPGAPTARPHDPMAVGGAELAAQATPSSLYGLMGSQWSYAYAPGLAISAAGNSLTNNLAGASQLAQAGNSANPMWAIAAAANYYNQQSNPAAAAAAAAYQNLGYVNSLNAAYGYPYGYNNNPIAAAAAAAAAAGYRPYGATNAGLMPEAYATDPTGAAAAAAAAMAAMGPVGAAAHGAHGLNAAMGANAVNLLSNAGVSLTPACAALAQAGPAGMNTYGGQMYGSSFMPGAGLGAGNSGDAGRDAAAAAAGHGASAAGGLSTGPYANAALLSAAAAALAAQNTSNAYGSPTPSLANRRTATGAAVDHRGGDSLMTGANSVTPTLHGSLGSSSAAAAAAAAAVAAAAAAAMPMQAGDAAPVTIPVPGQGYNVTVTLPTKQEEALWILTVDIPLYRLALTLAQIREGIRRVAPDSNVAAILHTGVHATTISSPSPPPAPNLNNGNSGGAASASTPGTNGNGGPPVVINHNSSNGGNGASGRSRVQTVVIAMTTPRTVYDRCVAGNPRVVRAAVIGAVGHTTAFGLRWSLATFPFCVSDAEQAAAAVSRQALAERSAASSFDHVLLAVHTVGADATIMATPPFTTVAALESVIKLQMPHFFLLQPNATIVVLQDADSTQDASDPSVAPSAVNAPARQTVSASGPSGGRALVPLHDIGSVSALPWLQNAVGPDSPQVLHLFLQPMVAPSMVPTVEGPASVAVLCQSLPSARQLYSLLRRYNVYPCGIMAESKGVLLCGDESRIHNFRQEVSADGTLLTTLMGSSAAIGSATRLYVTHRTQELQFFLPHDTTYEDALLALANCLGEDPQTLTWSVVSEGVIEPTNRQTPLHQVFTGGEGWLSVAVSGE